MMSQRIETLMKVEEMANKGMSDEEMAQKMSWSVGTVIHARMALGIRKTWKLSILEGFKKAAFKEGQGAYFQFGLDRTTMSELGLNPDKQVEFTGKILNNKLVLTIRNL